MSAEKSWFFWILGLWQFSDLCFCYKIGIVKIILLYTDTNSCFDYGVYGFGTSWSFFSIIIHGLVCSILDDPGALGLALLPQKFCVKVTKKMLPRSLKFEQTIPFVVIEKNVCHVLKHRFSFYTNLNSCLEN